MPNLFNGIVKLTEQQYNYLKTYGSITVGDITLDFDENTLYVTDYAIDTELDINSSNPVSNSTITQALQEKTSNGVTLDTNQEISGNKNFVGNITKNGKDVAIKEEIPFVSDSLDPQYKDNAMAVNQGIILNEKITYLIENINGKVQSFSVANLEELGTIFGIDISESKDEYIVSTNTITYKNKEYVLKTGDIFLIIDVSVPDYWFSLDDMKLFKLETSKVDLTNYATIEFVTNSVKNKAEQSSLDATNRNVSTNTSEIATLKANQKTKLSEMVSDAEHRTVTDSQINMWDNKIDEADLEGYATEEYVNQNGGKIDKITLNGVEQTIVNKEVHLEVEQITDYYKVGNKLTGIDLNTIVIPGNYGVANDCTNMPVKENGTLFVGIYENNQYAQQMFVSESNNVYVRASIRINNSTWNEWTKLTTRNELENAINSILESDPTVPDYVKSITEQDINNWNTKIEREDLGTLAFKNSLNKNDIGLGNVDNTSDLSKPISTATQNALDLKANQSDLDKTNENVSDLNSKVSNNETDIVDLQKNKVDKIEGKQLSTNDYTNEEKVKLESLSNYDDTSLSNKITAIESKIPSTASSGNQLVDRELMNSSIATNTATFRGTYNSVDELPTTGVDINDYAFVVVKDSAGNTLFKRYKYSGSVWNWEYDLNNSSFTADQWKAIQSGITNELVAQISTNESDIETLEKNKANTADLGNLAYKDNLTAGEVGALPNTTTYVSSVNGKSGAVTGILTSQDKPNINGNNTYNSANNFYAPTAKGNYGQLLMSNGTNAPSWTNMPDIQGSVTLSHILPSEYQEVEYVECDGGQLIDTQVISNGEDFKMEGNTYAPLDAGRSYNYFFASADTIDGPRGNYFYPGSNRNDYGIVISYPVSMFDKYLTLYSEDIFDKFISWSLILYKEHKTGRKDRLEILTEQGKEYFAEYTSTNSIANAKIILFSNDGSGLNETNSFVGKAGKFKIYIDGVIQRDLIPCYRKDDNVIGYYDLLNGVFYENIGSRPFVKGPDMPVDTIKQYQFMAQNIYQGTKRLADTYVPLERTISGKTLGKDIQLELSDIQTFEWSQKSNLLSNLLEKEYYKSKNILPVYGIGKTINFYDVDFTRNEDGTVTINGKGSISTSFYLSDFDDVANQSRLPLDPNKTYRISVQKISGKITGGYVSEENYLNDIAASGIGVHFDGSYMSSSTTSIGGYFNFTGKSELTDIRISFSQYYTYENFVIGFRLEEVESVEDKFLLGKGPIVHQQEMEEAIANIDTTETDPTVPSYVKSISEADISNWNNKLDSFTETDPTVPSYVKAITEEDIASWDSKVDANTQSLAYYTLSTGVGSKLELSIDTSTYVMTLKLTNSSGTVLDTKTIDLPLETMVVNAAYNNSTKQITLTLQNGTTTSFSVADLVSGLVPNTRKVNGKALSSDVTLSAGDVGALADTTTYVKSVNGASGDIDNIATTNTAQSLYKKNFNQVTINVGTSSTASSTAIKVVTLSNFELKTGAIIDVKFSNGSYYDTGSITGLELSLNVNSTGAKKIINYISSGAVYNYHSKNNYKKWNAGDTVRFRYDGTYWTLVANLTTMTSYLAPVFRFPLRYNKSDGTSTYWYGTENLDLTHLLPSTVQYVSQTLTDAQKTQARNNIGAGTSNFSGSYNDLTNKPTIPTNTNQLTNGAGFVTSSGSVASATKATQDGNGREISRIYCSMIPAGTAITANSNLNTTAFLKVGNYYCSSDNTTGTLTNCPTSHAFMMQVYSPLSTSIDNETTGQWVYRIRKIITYQAEEYIQMVDSGSTAGSFNYHGWTKIAKTSDLPKTYDVPIKTINLLPNAVDMDSPFVTKSIQIINSNNESDTHTYITHVSDASSSVSGLMSASDKRKLDNLYPVGSIYMSTQDISPASFLGGTWKRLKDRFLLGAGGSYAVNAEGGESSHTLTIDEMPSHSHSYQHTTQSSRGAGKYDRYCENLANYTTGSTGGSKAHNNMPPYLAVYMWERTP